MHHGNTDFPCFVVSERSAAALCEGKPACVSGSGSTALGHRVLSRWGCRPVCGDGTWTQGIVTPTCGHVAGGTQDPGAGGLQSMRPRGGDPQATRELVMGAAWLLDTRQVVGPEGSRLPTEGLLTVGGPCATSWVRGLAGWPGLLGRGWIRTDSGTPKVWVVTGRPALRRAVRRWEVGVGGLWMSPSAGPGACGAGLVRPATAVQPGAG